MIMKEYRTKTRELGGATFYAPAATEGSAGYLYVKYERGYRANERRQVCRGGHFLGEAVSVTTGDLKESAQKWLRLRRGWHRRVGI